MRDEELLQVLASDAPVPGPGHADEVLRRARRARMNRRATGFGAAMGVLAVLVVTGTVLSGRSEPGAAPVASVPPSPSSSARVMSIESQAYVTAIQTIAGRVPVLYMTDGFCDVMKPEMPCRPGLPAELRDDIAAAVPGVRFVPRSGEGILPIVTINELRREGEFVDIPISIVRGGLDAIGQTYRLKRVGEQWQVIGTVGGMWIA